jgi:predicted transglutaminase-like cysteine proteinase
MMIGLLLAGVVAANANPASRHALPLTTAALTHGDTRPPVGWADFCTRNSADCTVENLAAQDIALSRETMRLLTQINTQVNREIKAVSDLDHWGVVEHWDYPTDGQGDCEDYVLEKRKRLIKAGLPRQALLITVVRDKKGDGHAILTVKTDRGDFVLDNQEVKILPWSETGYRFVKRQSQENPNRWVTINPVGTPAMTAAR